MPATWVAGALLTRAADRPEPAARTHSHRVPEDGRVGASVTVEPGGSQAGALRAVDAPSVDGDHDAAASGATPSVRQACS
jgi:hypothetical protein